MPGTLRILLYTLLLGVAALAWVTADAAEKVTVKVTPRPKNAPKTEIVNIIGAFDNDDGTRSLYIEACGSTLVFKISAEAMETQDTDVPRFIMKKVEEVCK